MDLCCFLLVHHFFDLIVDNFLPFFFQLSSYFLLFSGQNGNRRIAKFCLRKGGNINQPNLAGNTPLHFCFAYGFEDLGEYLMDKGADDSVTNSDGLTCYEGLNMEAVEQI